MSRSLNPALSQAAVAGLRLPGPYVPGWFPLVADRAHAVVGPDEPIRQATVAGSRMELDVREYMQRRFFYNCFEGSAARFFRRWLRPGDVVLDVGAHVGFFTLLAGRLVGPGGEVHAFEPVPANFERLERNIALNHLPQVTANRTAVGEEQGEVSLGLAEERLVGTSTCDFTIGGGLSSVTAPVTTLDAYLEGREQTVRLIKIDVEGYEPQVFAGLATTLRERPPEAMLFEFNQSTLSAQGSSGTDLLTTFREAGYEVHRIGMRGDARPAPPPEQVAEAAERWESHEAPSSRLRVGLGTRNVLFNAVAIRR